jgi:hypothetical protein
VFTLASTCAWRIDPVRDPASEAQAARIDRQGRQERVIEATEPHPDHEQHRRLEASGDVSMSDLAAAERARRQR